MVHAFNSVFIIVDLFIAARPYRLLHIYQAIIPFLSYVIFSVIYWAAGGVTADGDTAIYPILDWDKLDSTLPILAAMLVALFPFQVILWSLHLLRDFLYRKAFHVKMKSPVMARDNEAFESNDRTDDIPVGEQKTLFWYDSFNANSFRVNTNDASELFVVRWATEWEQRIFFENEDTDVVNILKKKFQCVTWTFYVRSRSSEHHLQRLVVTRKFIW